MIIRDARATKAAVEIRRREDRFHTQAGWLDSRHSFSFSHHYDPTNTHFGLLLVSNDDVVRPGTGFMTHPHRDMEIVTIEGETVEAWEKFKHRQAAQTDRTMEEAQTKVNIVILDACRDNPLAPNLARAMGTRSVD